MRTIRILAVAACMFFAAVAARAQGTTQQLPVVPLGYCQLSTSALSAAVGLNSCVSASFTGSAGSGANANQLTTTSVSGYIRAGQIIISGTGTTAGTMITAQVSGTPGGAGVYLLSANSTSSSASMTSGGVPPNATMVAMQAETAAIRYRDDGGAPTASVGMELPSGQPPALYSGTLSNLQFIAATGSPLGDFAFYK